MLLGSSRETLEILFFSYRKKNAGAILLFLLRSPVSPDKGSDSYSSSRKADCRRLVRGVGEKESSRSFSLPRPQLSRLWTSMN